MKNKTKTNEQGKKGIVLTIKLKKMKGGKS